METAAVRVSVAPVLAARSVRSEQVTQALLGARVDVLEQNLRWARIRMEDGYEGWICRAHLAPMLLIGPELVSMTDLWVNLRTRPDFRMPATHVAFIGTSLPLQDRRPGWLGVALPGGGTVARTGYPPKGGWSAAQSVGWLEEHRGRVHLPDHSALLPAPHTLLGTARRFLGVPYLWGGCSPLGLDCSGFVQLVFRLHDIRLPRDAEKQAEAGRQVAISCNGRSAESTLAAGDAIFFHSEQQPDRITHVGLSLGANAFIHAAGSDRVRINELTGSSYGERLVCARRYLPDSPPVGL